MDDMTGNESSGPDAKLELTEEQKRNVAEEYAWPFEWKVATELRKKVKELREKLAVAQARVPNRLDPEGELDAEEWNANARLIAASPELLEACEFGDAITGPRLLEFAADLLARAAQEENLPSREYMDVAVGLRAKADRERQAIAKTKGDDR